MSLTTWKKKYYPVPADQVSEADAAEHSLAKWKGLRPAVLQLHRLELTGYTLYGQGGWFAINEDSCALCKHYISNIKCPRCPLKKHLGDVCDAYGQPFQRFTWKHDPEPMITALEAVVKKQKEGEL